jgi:hypothetical protein
LIKWKARATTTELILGLIYVFIAVGVIIFAYGYISGMVSEGEGIIVKREGIAVLFICISLILLLGLLGGIEIGRYVQTQLAKRET